MFVFWQILSFLKLFLPKAVAIIRKFHAKSKANLQVSDNRFCVGRVNIYYENCSHFGRIGCHFRDMGLQSWTNRENNIFPCISGRGTMFKLKFKSK